MLSRLSFDFIAALTLGLTATIGAYIPMYLTEQDRLTQIPGHRGTLLVFGNMFSAGVMVSAGFCHLLGEAVKEMPAMQFSLATFLCGLGYLATLCADKAATMLTSSSSSTSSSTSLGHNTATINDLKSIDHGVEVTVAVDLAERGGLGNTPDRILSSLSSRHSNGSLTVAKHAMDNSVDDDDFHDSAPLLTSNGLHLDSTTNIGNAATRMGSFEISEGMPYQRGASKPPLHSSSDGNSNSCHPQHVFLSNSTNNNKAGKASVSFITAVLMAVALCFHSILEGAAMGAQPTLSNSLHIFIAIVSHKGLAAYALGSSIAEAGVDYSKFWSVAIPFILASPAGIFLGYIVSDLAKGVGAASISALASGTFLYVAFMEVIPREMHTSDRMPGKLGMLLLGFGLMSLLAIWA